MPSTISKLVYWFSLTIHFAYRAKDSLSTRIHILGMKSGNERVAAASPFKEILLGSKDRNYVFERGGIAKHGKDFLIQFHMRVFLQI